MSTIALDRIAKQFGDFTALEDVSFTIEPGEFLVLLGASGSGKSTALRLIAGLEDPTSGTITIDGAEVASGSRSIPPHRRDIGFVFQSYALWPHLSVRKNVAFPLRYRATGADRAEVRRRVDAALELVELGELGDRAPGELSGGQQQRVALARAIVSQPGILLLDEPLSNLDARLRIQLRDQLKALHERLGFTAVYVTHDQTEAMALGDRIVVFDRGRIQQIGRPDEIFLQPASTFVADFVGFENLVPVTLEPAHEPTHEPALALALGTTSGPELPHPPTHAPAPRTTAIARTSAGISLSVPAPAKPPRQPTLAIRSQHLTGHRDPAPGRSPARIELVEYQGTHHSAVFAVGDERWHGRLPLAEWGTSSAAIDTASEIAYVAFDPAGAVLLEGAR